MTNIHAQALGRIGGKKSAKKRFAGLSKKEISQMMSKVRKTKFTPSQKLADCLNDSVLEQHR